MPVHDHLGKTRRSRTGHRTRALRGSHKSGICLLTGIAWLSLDFEFTHRLFGSLTPLALARHESFTVGGLGTRRCVYNSLAWSRPQRTSQSVLTCRSLTEGHQASQVHSRAGDLQTWRPQLRTRTNSPTSTGYTSYSSFSAWPSDCSPVR